MRIAVAAYEPLLSYVRDKLSGCYQEIEFTYLAVQSLQELPEQFLHIREGLDGLITGGQVMTAYLQRTCPDCPLIESLELDALDVCRVLLQMSREHPGLDFSRVFFDFIYDDTAHAMVADLLGSKDFQHFPLASEGDEPYILQNLEDISSVLEKTYLRLYTQGKIDYVVTRYTYAEPILNRYQIPFYYTFPGLNHIRLVVERLINRIQLAQREDSCPAVVRIDLATQGVNDDLMLKSSRLFQLLLLYARNCGGDFIVQSSGQGYEVFTTFRTVLRVTERLSHCGILDYLREHHAEEVFIGYGVGRDMQEARSGALYSQAEAMKQGVGYSGYQVFGKRGLLSASGGRRNGSSYYLEISKKAGLPIKTVSRLAAIGKDQKITSQNLADRLGMTVRSANRLLKRLTETGLAEISPAAQANRRGRPENVYVLKL